MITIPSNPTGWLLSEKYDGARCFVTESGTLLSRNGHQFKAPKWFTAGLPKGVRLDCELCAGRGGFDHLVSEIQRKKSEWESIRLIVLDLAVLRVPIERRIATLKGFELPPHVTLAEHRPCLGNDDLDATEAEIVSGGGEGVILREACSFYRPGAFVKVKRLFPDLNRSFLD
jgi:ATP-dependent DNA ligase